MDWYLTQQQGFQQCSKQLENLPWALRGVCNDMSSFPLMGWYQKLPAGQPWCHHKIGDRHMVFSEQSDVLFLFFLILFNFHFLSVSVTLSWMSVYLTWTLKPENTQSWKQCVRDRKASKPGVQHGSRSHLHVAGAVFETQNNSFLFSAQSLQKQLWFPGPLFWATEAVLPYLNTRATLALTYVL